MDSHWTVTVLQFSVLLALIALVFRVKFPAALGWPLVAGSVFIVGALTLNSSALGIDAKFFWTAGCHVWEGIDPYSSPAVMNPPTAFPFYALFALMPFLAFSMLWKVVNFAGCLSLTTLAGRLDDQANQQSAMIVSLLGAAVLLSFPYRYGIVLGQLSLMTTLVVFVALWCQQREWPVAAGLFMAIASMKPATMLPFLLLFCRRRDWKSWVSMTAVGFGLTFMTVPPMELPQRLANCLANIKHAGEPGQANDYSFESTNNRELISFDYAFYHLGLRDRSHVQLAQLLAVGLLGAWVAWQVMGRSRLSQGAARALVCCYATLFLYHRLYDMLLLSLPLVYTVGQARTERGRARWLYAACALGIFGTLYVRLELLKNLTEYAMQPGLAAWLVEALLLPYGTWLMLAVVVGLSLAERWKTVEPEADVLMARAEVGERPGTARFDITRVSAGQLQSR